MERAGVNMCIWLECTWAKVNRVDGGTVDILVSNNTVFRLLQKLLRQNSKVFDTALRPEWVDRHGDAPIDLKHVEYETFNT
jgi:hypothetical protein